MARNLYDRLTEYIIENQQKFYRVAYTYVRDRENALDVVQNAVCKALENYKSLKQEDAMKTWFYRILVNESLNFLRKSQREITFEPEEFPVEIYEEPAYEAGLHVYEEVASLPDSLRTVVILHYFEELTLKEIAQVTDTNLNTVKTRLYSALRRLKTIVQEREKCI